MESFYASLLENPLLPITTTATTVPKNGIEGQAPVTQKERRYFKRKESRVNRLSPSPSPSPNPGGSELNSDNSSGSSSLFSSTITLEMTVPGRN